MPLVRAYMLPHPPLALPEVGRGEEKRIENTTRSFQRAAAGIAELKPDTIIVTSPHAPSYRDFLHISAGLEAEGSFARFGAPQVQINVKYDTLFARALAEEAKKKDINAVLEEGARLDHGVLVPLYFVERLYKDYKLLRVGISGHSFKELFEFGELIGKKALKSGSCIFIASGDLSHKLKPDGPYGFAEEGPLFDKRFTEIVESGELQRFLEIEEIFAEKAAECGLRSFLMLAGALQGLKYKAELLSYEGPFGVGYGAAEIRIVTVPPS